MLSILEYTLSMGKVFILEFLTQIGYILIYHISLFEKIDFLEYWGYQSKIPVLSFILGFEQYLDHGL
jgi:hypothetical protein